MAPRHHLPSRYLKSNREWMWAALLAASLTGWLHQLTACSAADGALLGHGVRNGQAMIATLRHRLIRVSVRSGWLVRHAALILRLSPDHDLLSEVLARIRALPAVSRVCRFAATFGDPFRGAGPRPRRSVVSRGFCRSLAQDPDVVAVPVDVADAQADQLETRTPGWISSASRAWSRRPSQVPRSGAASSAVISVGSR